MIVEKNQYVFYTALKTAFTATFIEQMTCIKQTQMLASITQYAFFYCFSLTIIPGILRLKLQRRCFLYI